MLVAEAEDWHFATENYDTDFHAEVEILRNAVAHNPDLGAARHTKALATYEGGHSKWYFSRRESLEVSDVLIERFVTDLPWAEGLYAQIVRSSDGLHEVYAGIDASAFPGWDTEELLSLYRRQRVAHGRLLQAAWPIEEMHTTVNSIEDKLRHRVLSEDVPLEEYPRLLWTSCPSSRTAELRELQGVLDAVVGDPRTAARMASCAGSGREVEAMPHGALGALSRIQERYGCSAYHGHGTGKPKGVAEYAAEMAGHVLDGTPYCEPAAGDGARRGFDDTCKRHGVSPETKRIMSAYASLGQAKTMRRLAELRNYYFIDRMMDALAERSGISVSVMRCMTPEEFCAMPRLSKGEVASIARRAQGMTYTNVLSEETITYGVDLAPTDGVFDADEPAVGDILVGMSACPGRVVAVARLGLTLSDKARLREDFVSGSVLVSNEPNPDWLEIIARSGAVVTDQGGVTCHVASIARELNTPCVVGTRIATRVIHDGDLLLVDATRGQVHILERRTQ